MIGASETNPVLRWMVIAVLSIATAGMVAVSMRANFLFGYGFGQSPEKAQVFGWANVAADLWKVSGLILIGSLWRVRRRRLAVLLFLIWLLCLLWGMAGAIGVYAQDRTAFIGSREDVAATYADAERELHHIETRLTTLTDRTIEQVDTAIAAVLARPVRSGNRVRGTVGKLSANCTRENRATADACLEVARLREERASAEEAARLRNRAAELRELIETLRRSGGSLPADPAAELLAWLSAGQLKVRDISFGFPLVFALLIELISAFGPAGVAAYAEGTRRKEGEGSATQPAAARRGELRPTVASLGTPGRVVQWLAERTEPTTASVALSVEQLYRDYYVWCATTDVVAADAEGFERELDRVRSAPELGGAIRKFGRRYFGLRLLSAPVALLPKRRTRS